MTADSAVSPFDLPDVNVLVALTNPAHQHHRRAHEWLAGVTVFATTPITENGLVRLLLNPSVVGQPVSPIRALEILRGVRADHRARFIQDGSSLASARIDLIGLAGFQKVTDLHLVNLVASLGGRLATFDRRLPAALAEPDRPHVTVL